MSVVIHGAPAMRSANDCQRFQNAAFVARRSSAAIRSSTKPATSH